MALNPHVQQKVQAHIDEIFGKEPHVFCLSDREKLPYVEATIMEIQVWIYKWFNQIGGQLYGCQPDCQVNPH